MIAIRWKEGWMDARMEWDGVGRVSGRIVD